MSKTLRSEKKHFETLQVCRAVAATLVVAFHTGATLSHPKYFGTAADLWERLTWSGGDSGVAFFFVLSGFIITLVHRPDFGNPPRLGEYLRRRAIRIYPSYITVFLCVYVAARMIPSLSDSVPRDPIIILKSLLLLPQDQTVVGGTGAPVLVVAWSLQYEMVFYAAVAVAIVNPKLCLGLAAVYAYALIHQILSSPLQFPLNFLSSHLILLFLMGVLAAMVFESGLKLQSSGRVAVASVLGFLSVSTISTLTHGVHYRIWFNLAYGLFGSLTVISLAVYESGGYLAKRLKLWNLLGDSSYAIYLIHFPLISLLSKVAYRLLPKSEVGATFAFLGIVLTCLLSGVLFHLYVERSIFLGLRRTGKRGHERK